MPLIVENFVGRHIFRVVSPSGRFAPVDATFVVTNAALSQSVTGQVFLNGSPATNAVVVALTGQDWEYAGAAMVDSLGRYSLRLPPNSYALIASQADCYFDTSLLPPVVLNSGVTATNNLYLTNGTVTLSGSVRDATNNSGLGGLFLILQSGDYLAIAFTASNGTFSAAVSPAFWRTQIQEDRAGRRGYVGLQDFPQVNTSTGAVANVDLRLPKADALFYGRLTSNLGVPFPNTRFEANDGQNGPGTFKSKGFSDANGYYAVGVLGQTNGWHCSPDASPFSLLSGYIVSQGQYTVLAAGQTSLQNFTALPATAQISGLVRDDTGNPVEGVEVGGNGIVGGNYFNAANVQTDSAGYYSLAVAPGQ